MNRVSRRVLMLGLGLSLAAVACGRLAAPGVVGSGIIKAETRPASGFTAVEIHGTATVIIDETGSESVTVEADDNILPLIITEVKGDRLVVDIKPGSNISRATRLDVKITARQLDEISLSGTGSVKATGLKGDKLSVRGSGTGLIEVEGSVTEQDVKLSGVGTYVGDKLVSDKARVHVSGVGGATVNVKTSLDATVSGTGSVAYLGSPKVTQKISGIGSVGPKK